MGERPNDCVHLSASEEACRLDAVTGEETPITVHLCTWADAHPERMMDAPRWLSSWALAGGPNFNPDKHCAGCPGYAGKEADRG